MVGCCAVVDDVVVVAPLSFPTLFPAMVSARRASGEDWTCVGSRGCDDVGPAGESVCGVSLLEVVVVVVVVVVAAVVLGLV